MNIRDLKALANENLQTRDIARHHMLEIYVDRWLVTNLYRWVEFDTKPIELPVLPELNIRLDIYLPDMRHSDKQLDSLCLILPNSKYYELIDEEHRKDREQYARKDKIRYGRSYRVYDMEYTVDRFPETNKLTSLQHECRDIIVTQVDLSQWPKVKKYFEEEYSGLLELIQRKTEELGYKFKSTNDPEENPQS